ncbi:MAG: D-2-hydroxyacid dehydrogenase [Saprospiraceae bacterium]|nr:D-2-hydroxyacid dehydrogenase [Saprospiraceae bacterium]
MNVVILDGYTVNPGDLSWAPIEAHGQVTIYDRTSPDQIFERSRFAEILVVNKVKIRGDLLAKLPMLRVICLLATGYDNVDVDAAQKYEVKVYNAVGYGTESVAQHTLAMILAFTNRIESHHRSVQHGDWADQDDFSYSLNSVRELKGKTLGIIGYGKIGRRVGDLASAFGMQVLTLSRSGEKEGARVVDQKTLFQSSHFISLHAPLNEGTREIVNQDTLEIMRKDAIIINTGRGGLIKEKDLIRALYTKVIAGAVLDVLTIEPPRASNGLCYLENAWITPHMAWKSFEAREALILIVAKNINHYINGVDTNRVV